MTAEKEAGRKKSSKERPVRLLRASVLRET
jgi:hypothetical protein